MLDIKKLRENLDDVDASLLKRGYSINKDVFNSLDKKRKVLQIDVENLQAERKKLSLEFGKLKEAGENIDDLKKTIDIKNIELEGKDKDLQIVLDEINQFLLDIPNIPHDSVPNGKNESDNVVIKEYGTITTKNSLDHLEIQKI